MGAKNGRSRANVKPETIIKGFIEIAASNLRRARPDERHLTRWSDRIAVNHPANPERDFDVIVELYGASRLGGGPMAQVFHPEHGHWKACMNGLRGWNVGKPSCQHTVEEMKAEVAAKRAGMLWPHLGF